MNHCNETKGNPFISVALVLGAFAGILAFMWLLPLTPLGQWQRTLHWNYASHVAFLILPFVVMALAGRTPGEYGLRSNNVSRELTVGGVAFVVLVAAPLVGEGVFGQLRLKQATVGFVASTAFFQIVLSGFGEEFLFRGFFQGELNRALGRPLSWGNLRFGWGVIVTAALFGIGHLLNPFNPLTGQVQFDIAALFMTGIAGLVFGFVREYFGGILAASLIHAGWDLISSLFDLGAAGNIATGVAIFGLCVYLTNLINSSGDPAESGSKDSDDENTTGTTFRPD